MPKFADIKRMTKSPGYMVNVSWQELRDHVDHLVKDRRFLMEPPFQRSHVWDLEDQIAYVEYALRGGLSGMDIYCNARRWGTGEGTQLVLVDGLQRITAVLAFLDDKVPVFGHTFSEYEDTLGWNGPHFNWHVNDLPTMQMVIDWYVELNTSGRAHTKAEIDVALALRSRYDLVHEFWSAVSGRYLGCAPREHSVGDVVNTMEVIEKDESMRDCGLIKYFARRVKSCPES